MPNTTLPSSLLIPNKTIYSVKRCGGTNNWETNAAVFHKGNSTFIGAPTLEEVSQNLAIINKKQDKKGHEIKKPRLFIKDGYLTLSIQDGTMILTYTALKQLLAKTVPTNARESMKWLDFLQSPADRTTYLGLVNKSLADANFDNKVLRTARTMVNGQAARIAFGITSETKYNVFDGEDMCAALAALGDYQVQSFNLSRESFDIRITEKMDASKTAEDMLHVPVTGYSGRTNFVTEGSTIVDLIIQKLVCTNGMRSSSRQGGVKLEHWNDSDKVKEEIKGLAGAKDNQMLEAYMTTTKVIVPPKAQELIIDDYMMQVPTSRRPSKSAVDICIKNLSHPSNFPRDRVAKMVDAVTFTAHNNFSGKQQLLLEEAGTNMMFDFLTQQSVDSRIAELIKAK